MRLYSISLLLCVNIKTNHLLRATGATVTFQNNVPEKIIQNTTGHRSLESLRVYETASDEQQQAVSKILMSYFVPGPG